MKWIKPPLDRLSTTPTSKSRHQVLRSIPPNELLALEIRGLLSYFRKTYFVIFWCFWNSNGFLFLFRGIKLALIIFNLQYLKPPTLSSTHPHLRHSAGIIARLLVVLRRKCCCSKCRTADRGGGVANERGRIHYLAPATHLETPITLISHLQRIWTILRV